MTSEDIDEEIPVFNENKKDKNSYNENMNFKGGG